MSRFQTLLLFNLRCYNKAPLRRRAGGAPGVTTPRAINGGTGDPLAR